MRKTVNEYDSTYEAAGGQEQTSRDQKCQAGAFDYAFAIGIWVTGYLGRHYLSTRKHAVLQVAEAKRRTDCCFAGEIDVMSYVLTSKIREKSLV